MDSSRTAVREQLSRLDLVFGLKSGKTILRNSYAEVPFKITRLYYPQDSNLAQLIIMNTTAGLFPGDRLATQIRVETGARVLITSQASTKVHPGEGIVEQSLHAEVAPDAELHIYNDPLIPFRGARLRQRVCLNVAESGRLRFWDALMAGRVSRGEAWEFEEIDNEIRIVRDGKLLYLERYRLSESSPRPDFHYIATGIFCEPIPSEFLECHDSRVGVDEPVPGLAVVRAVADTGVAYRTIQQRVLTHAFECRNEKTPDLRKY